MSKHTLFTRKVKLKICVGIFLIVGLCGTLFFIRSSAFLDWVERRLETELKNRMDNTYRARIGKIEGEYLREHQHQKHGDFQGKHTGNLHGKSHIQI